MISDEERQRMIVRQSSLKLAVELLISEKEIDKSAVSIPVESIKKLSKQFEDYVFEVQTQTGGFQNYAPPVQQQIAFD